MPDDKRDYGRALRIIRASRGMSQGQVAERAGVKPSYLSMLERGERENPTVQVLSALARAMGASLANLEILAISKKARSSLKRDELDALAILVFRELLR